jgi:hypothetical protein
MQAKLYSKHNRQEMATANLTATKAKSWYTSRPGSGRQPSQRPLQVARSIAELEAIIKYAVSAGKVAARFLINLPHPLGSRLESARPCRRQVGSHPKDM